MENYILKECVVVGAGISGLAVRFNTKIENSFQIFFNIFLN